MQKYHCNDCLSDVDAERIGFNELSGDNICPECGNNDLDYFEDDEQEAPSCQP